MHGISLHGKLLSHGGMTASCTCCSTCHLSTSSRQAYQSSTILPSANGSACGTLLSPVPLASEETMRALPVHALGLNHTKPAGGSAIGAGTYLMFDLSRTASQTLSHVLWVRSSHRCCS